MEARIVAILDQLEREGGIVAGVAEGRVQAEVNRNAYELEKRIRRGDCKKVGVNCFVEEGEEEREIEFHGYREDEARKQIARLEAIRARRDRAAVDARLAAVREAARGKENVMPAVIDAVEAYATVGELCGALIDVFGRYREPVRF
jgi:methylmalonyl-CoA mutase N-terminal domain/subunit